MDNNLQQFGFVFQYRETKDSKLKQERFFICSDRNNVFNDSEIAMLQFLKKHGYYSGKVIRIIVIEK